MKLLYKRDINLNIDKVNRYKLEINIVKETQSDMLLQSLKSE